MTKRGVKRLTEEDIAHIEAMKKMCQLEILHMQSKERYHSDPEFRERVNRCNQERRKRQFDTDPEYREKVREYARNYREMHKDEINAQRREQYHSDPEFREKMNQSSSAYKRRRYHSDPEFRKKQAEYALKRYYKRKAERAKEAAECSSE